MQTDGSIIDYAVVEDDVLADAEVHQVAEVAYDPWGATQLAVTLQEEHDITVVEVPQKTSHLSEPMKWIEALVLAGRFHHTGDPVLAWAMSNVTAKADANENVFPRKEAPENKIDPVVALILAMSRALLGQNDGGSVYEGRGVLSF